MNGGIAGNAALASWVALRDGHDEIGHVEAVQEREHWLPLSSKSWLADSHLLVRLPYWERIDQSWLIGGRPIQEKVLHLLGKLTIEIRPQHYPTTIQLSE